MNSNSWKVENLLAALFVTILGGIILAYIIQDGRFDPNRNLPTPSPVPIPRTNSNASIQVRNELVRPIRIEIEGQYRGNVNPGIVKTFFLDSYPVHVRWEAVKKTTSSGTEIGVTMAGTWDNVQAGRTVTVNHIVGENKYFYPSVTNKTNYRCSVIINQGLRSEVNPKASVDAGKTAGFGYYRYYSNSNIVLNCANGKAYWWGIRNRKGSTFTVDGKSGYVRFTLNP